MLKLTFFVGRMTDSTHKSRIHPTLTSTDREIMVALLDSKKQEDSAAENLTVCLGRRNGCSSQNNYKEKCPKS